MLRVIDLRPFLPSLTGFGVFGMVVIEDGTWSSFGILWSRKQRGIMSENTYATFHLEPDTNLGSNCFVGNNPFHS
jgi:hypothetical protein